MNITFYFVFTSNNLTLYFCSGEKFAACYNAFILFNLHIMYIDKCFKIQYLKDFFKSRNYSILIEGLLFYFTALKTYFFFFF